MSSARGSGRAPAGRREVVAWCLFDFANSAYTTLIATVAFSVYFREAVVGGADNRADALWGAANFAGMSIVLLMSPVAGAAADVSGSRKRFLVLSTLVSIAATGALATVGPGDVALGVALYVASLVGYEIGYVFYNSFLAEVSTPRTLGRVSGWAWAVGYVGGLLSLALCYPLLRLPLREAPGAALDPEAVLGRQWSFLVVAGFFLVFSLPAFVWLRESKPQGESGGRLALVTAGWRRVAATVRDLRERREAAKYVLASICYTDGISTVILFSAIYATATFGFASAELVVLFLVLNVLAFPGALAAGYLADGIGAKATLAATLVLWIGVVALAALGTGKASFWVMATGAALGMGSTQAVGRSLMAEISPPSREAEYFGFYVLSGKLGSMLGPLVFGMISSATGSQRLAVVSLLPFFVAGLLLVLGVDVARAREQAAARERAASP